MASPVKLYQKEMHDNLGFFATWLPGDRIELGEVGTLEGGRFRKQTSLSELHIPYAASPESPPQTLQYTSTAGTKLGTSAGAAAGVPVARAEFSVEFSEEGAFLFHASNLRHVRLENRLALADGITRAHDRGVWDEKWFLVESLHVAECATILVAQDKSAGITLRAEADIPLGSIPLADPRVSLAVVSTRGKVVHVVGGQNLSPLYSCLRLKKTWLGHTSVVPVRGEVPGASAAEAFARPSLDELLDS